MLVGVAPDIGDGFLLFLEVCGAEFIEQALLASGKRRASLRASRVRDDHEGKKIPAVLAVVISHNSIDYVANAIQSLIRQDYPRLRCVVIDNASIDGTLEVASRYAGLVEVVANKENVGFSAALNQTLELVGDEEFLFIHQDDVRLMEDHYISMAIRHFDNGRVAAVTGQTMPVGDSRTKRLMTRYLGLDDREGTEVHEGSWPHLKADLFRLNALREIGGFSYAGDYRLGVEDQIMGHKLHQANYVVLRDPNITYRVDFARCGGFGQFLRKEWDTGRCLGSAIALGVISPNPSKSKVDLARRNHRIQQVLFVCLLLALTVAAIAGWSSLKAIAAVLVGRGLWLAFVGGRLGVHEAFVFALWGVAGDVAFGIPFLLMLGASFIGKTKAKVGEAAGLARRP